MKNVVLWEWFEENCYHAGFRVETTSDFGIVRAVLFIPNSDYVIKLDKDVLVNPFILEDYIMSFTGNAQLTT